MAGAPVTDRIDQYTLSDGNGGRAGVMSPFVNPKQMESTLAQSPLTYAAKVKAPTLILALTGDYRVPITQAYAYYHALRDNGVTVQFVGYPLPGHSPTDPVHQRDVDRREDPVEHVPNRAVRVPVLDHRDARAPGGCHDVLLDLADLGQAIVVAARRTR